MGWRGLRIEARIEVGLRAACCEETVTRGGSVFPP